MNEIKTVRNHAKKSRWLLIKTYKVCLGISQVQSTLYDKSETHLFIIYKHTCHLYIDRYFDSQGNHVNHGYHSHFTDKEISTNR